MHQDQAGIPGGYSAPAGTGDPGPTHVGGPESGFASFRALFVENFHQAITYCAVYGSLGMCVALLGPTLLDLGCFTSYPLISTLSWIVFAQGLFSVIGSRFASLLVKWSSPHLTLLASTILLAGTIGLIPLCTHIVLLLVVISIMGFFMGTVDVISNICMMALFEKRVGPFLQSLHFCYGLGAFIAPLVVEPYLLRNGCSHEGTAVKKHVLLHGHLDHHQHHLGTTTHAPAVNESHHLANASHHLVGQEHEFEHIAAQQQHRVHVNVNHTAFHEPHMSPDSEADLEHAFWLMALLQIPTIILAASLVIRRRLAGYDESRESDQVCEIMNKGFEIKGIINKWKDPDAEDEYARGSASERQTKVVTSLASVMTFMADGLQAVFGSYIYTFAVKYVEGMDAVNGVHLTASFWGMFAFGRFMSIGLATKISSATILLLNTVGSLVSIGMMVCFPHNHAAFYAGSGLFGLFLSSTFPTVTSLVSSYINMNPSITTQLVICAVIGETSLPVILGHFFENLGPESFLFTILLLCLVNFIVFLVLYKSGTLIVPPTGHPGPMEILFGAVFHGSSAKGESAVLMNATESVQVYSRMDGGSSDNSIHDGNFGGYEPRQQFSQQ